MADIPQAFEHLEKELLAHLRQKASEGRGALQKEIAYNETAKCMRFVEGNTADVKNSVRALSNTSANRVKKAVLEITSALTDVRPIWNYQTYNEAYSEQGEILNKLARGWWKNNLIDRRLQSILTFSAVGGSGYGMLSWNETLPGGGDFELIPLDPRDVIPIDPTYSDSMQDWRGVIVRQRLPISVAQSMFPMKAYKLGASTSSWFPQREVDAGASSTVVSAVMHLFRGSDTVSSSRDGVDIMRIFLKDDCLHTGQEPRLMGDPGSNWSYWVYASGTMKPDGTMATPEDAKLYPRGRLIICTPEAILKDIPNPYWHGLFPIVRFTLDPLPWSLLGAALVNDLVPLQGSLNESLRGLDDGIAQWVKRGIVADKRTIGEETLKALDSRKAGLRASINPGMGKGFEILDGPTFPTWYMEYISFLVGQMDELSGVRGLNQLAQMKAMPSEDAMEKYTDALSPLLRLRARSIELSLGELAEMIKVGFFQYYDAKRRMQILGKDGLAMEDFDFDPATMVPAGDGTREERAQKHHRNFTFSIAPNSFLNVSHTTQKMLVLQLFRANMLDPWTAWEAFDLPNIGKPPAETIPDRMVEAKRQGILPGPTPEELQMQRMMMAAQTQQVMGQMAMMQNMMPQGQASPQGAPRTSGVGPQGGRPPSGQEAPQFVTRDGGQRIVVSESGS